ncbi:MAG: hypothetical protein LBT71_00785 [Azoarcus sp.]|jgi:hypothetical protein|nr:hypothetical protein [Azoarcus sp.]
MNIPSILRNLFLFVSLSSGFSANAQNLTPVQIKQIEDIARFTAAHINSNVNKQEFKQEMLDQGIISVNATAVGRNVRSEYIIPVRMPPNAIKEWLDETKAEIIPKICALNKNNNAFNRGLSYTYAYSNVYGEKLGEVFVDKATCRNLEL